MNPVIMHSNRLGLEGESKDNLERVYLDYFLAGLGTERSIELALADLGLEYCKMPEYGQIQQVQKRR